jgi:hypothetical protein
MLLVGGAPATAKATSDRVATHEVRCPDSACTSPNSTVRRASQLSEFDRSKCLRDALARVYDAIPKMRGRSAISLHFDRANASVNAVTFADTLPVSFTIGDELVSWAFSFDWALATTNELARTVVRSHSDPWVLWAERDPSDPLAETRRILKRDASDYARRGWIVRRHRATRTDIAIRLNPSILDHPMECAHEGASVTPTEALAYVAAAGLYDVEVAIRRGPSRSQIGNVARVDSRWSFASTLLNARPPDGPRAPVDRSTD